MQGINWKIYAKRMGGRTATNFACICQHSVTTRVKTSTIPNLKIYRRHFADCVETSKKPSCAAGVNGQGLGRHFYPRPRFAPAIGLRGHQRPTKMF